MNLYCFYFGFGFPLLTLLSLDCFSNQLLLKGTLNRMEKMKQKKLNKLWINVQRNKYMFDEGEKKQNRKTKQNRKS